ncbi:nucleoside recognition domain-containing protein [Crocosphaera sp. XPORK-15E]|uniref:nucleoside recognition domain-containing protein n=1 Tax=Crocosphaera sp. XPORK-15E TaxID=3110247 RepID=UPI002B2074CE|nr:nucleoside recognition domain-containing protein [Crocosphaera sp. XPORK-15E]MEA5533401.1 nucleoside recognition domain-containing protein [Crocosphaera sp. XPORK-15E]
MTTNLRYPTAIEEGITKIECLLTSDKNVIKAAIQPLISRRCLALLLLQKDPLLWRKVREQETSFEAIETAVNSVQSQFSDPLILVIAKTRHQAARKLEESAIVKIKKKSTESEEFFHQLTVNPITGFPLLFIIHYLGIYQLVGGFGSGILARNLDNLFLEKINPFINLITAQLLPWTVLQDLVANDYGILTLGIRYSIAIILPIVTTFFLMFTLLEDSGYLPRISLLVDHLFKIIGLSGRSIIPLILGLGCGSVGSLVTRTIESKRERFIVSLLLALVIPCSAQLGVIVGLLSQDTTALFIWGGVITLIFAVVGLLMSKALPGSLSYFYMEIPPLRLPNTRSILTKTYSRVRWYLSEVIPLFILGSVLIWIGKLTGLLTLLTKILEPIMISLGLPPQASIVFLYGFFRRDYGAAGMFDLHHSGILMGRQLVVAAVILTLFIPCFSQVKFMLKEQGIKKTIMITTFVTVFAFSMGYLLNQLLLILEVNP